MTNKLQKGFIFRQENCVGCGGCAVACQIHNELPEDVRFRKVDLYEVKDKEGRVRDVWLTHSCMHCTNPSCMAVCPANAAGFAKTPARTMRSSSAALTARPPNATSAWNCLTRGLIPPAWTAAR